MSSQDMQFADPEWQPPEEREDNVHSREQTVPPRPINANRLDQEVPQTSRPQWQPSPPQEGYLGPGYAASQPQTAWSAPVRPISRRRGNPWRWIILAFIIIALMSGAFSRGFGSDNSSVPGPNFSPQVQNFSVATTPTININSGGGDINISTGGSSNQVSIQESPNGSFFGNKRDANVNATQSGNTITVNDQGDPSGDIGLNIVVPSNANLQITTTDGSIEVDGINGQMTLQSNNGSITANNDALTGPSTLSSQSGDVTFSGSIDTGNYQFQSTNGSVNVTLPSNSNFQVTASTGSGSIDTSDFPSVHTTNTGAQGTVGNPSTAKQTTLTLTSDSGDLTLSASS